MSRFGFLAVFVLSGLACETAANPCPLGTRPRYDLNRCVSDDETSVGKDTDGGSTVSDAMVPMDAASGDAQADANVELDDAGSAGSPDAATSDPATPDATSPDPVPSDAGGLPDAGVEPLCSRADLDAVRDFHLSDGMVDTLVSCFAQGCEETECAAVSCTMEAARIEACDECVDAEARCLMASCGAACGEPGSDLECRACVCEADCVRTFERCTLAPLPVCESVFGRDSTADERAVEGPILFKQKSATGLIQSTLLVATPASPKPVWTFTANQSAGWTRLLAWSQGTSDYLLQYKGACTEPPCRMRVSHVLRDGSLGRPVFEGRVPAGFEQIELLVVKGRTFLAMYSPTLQTDGTVGTLRIVEAVEQAGALDLVTRLERASRSTTGPWSLLEAFVESETVYLTFYDVETGELQIDAVSLDANELVLREHTRAQWESGLTMIEAFAFAGETQLLTYRADNGSTRIAPLVPQGSVFALGPVKLEATWALKLDFIETFMLDGATHLLRQARASGVVEVMLIASDTSTWQASLGPFVYVDAWGKKPVWDLVAVSHAGNW